ncbi:MAG TPA: ABC transporter substrate-binding protein [Dehalococcoidia bacterium]|nr:ABC transporter substrate-binding protein [Dehalococcoidia bacterium]
MRIPLRIGEPYHVVYYAPLHVAQCGGFFEAEDLDVEITAAASFAAIVAGWGSPSDSGVAGGGTTDVAVGGIMRSLVAFDRGETPVPVHFARVNDRDGFLLLGRAHGFEWHNLLDRRLIVFAEAPTPLHVLRSLLLSRGLDPDRIDVIDDVPIARVAEAFRNGIGDFVLTQSHVAEELTRGGDAILLRAMAEEAESLPYSSYYCPPDYVIREPESVRRVARANAAAIRWMQSHSGDEIWESIRPDFAEGDAETLRAATVRYKALGVWSSDTTLPPLSYARLAAAMQRGGLITRIAPYELVIRDQAARTAEAELDGEHGSS